MTYASGSVSALGAGALSYSARAAVRSACAWLIASTSAWGIDAGGNRRLEPAQPRFSVG
jgi:hypothetical protein